MDFESSPGEVRTGEWGRGEVRASLPGQALGASRRARTSYSLPRTAVTKLQTLGVGLEALKQQKGTAPQTWRPEVQKQGGPRAPVCAGDPSSSPATSSVWGQSLPATPGLTAAGLQVLPRHHIPVFLLFRECWTPSSLKKLHLQCPSSKPGHIQRDWGRDFISFLGGDAVHPARDQESPCGSLIV